MNNMSMVMHEKFNKYWSEINVLMAMASVLDPRYKFTMVDYCFAKLYHDYEFESRVGDIKSKLNTLFEVYANEFVAKVSTIISSSSSNSSHSSVTGSSSGSCRSQMDEFYAIRKSKVSSQKSDLEVYLEKPELLVVEAEGDPFVVLDWWKINNVKYPALSRMARDILCIPVSTVASESAFSAGGRVLDDYRSSLTADMVEVLVCNGDWIRTSMKAEFHTLRVRKFI